MLCFLAVLALGVPAVHRVQVDVPAAKVGVDIDCESEGSSCQYRLPPAEPGNSDSWYNALLDYTKRKRSELVSWRRALQRNAHSGGEDYLAEQDHNNFVCVGFFV